MRMPGSLADSVQASRSRKTGSTNHAKGCGALYRCWLACGHQVCNEVCGPHQEASTHAFVATLCMQPLTVAQGVLRSHACMHHGVSLPCMCTDQPENACRWSPSSCETRCAMHAAAMDAASCVLAATTALLPRLCRVDFRVMLVRHDASTAPGKILMLACTAASTCAAHACSFWQHNQVQCLVDIPASRLLASWHRPARACMLSIWLVSRHVQS